MGRNKNTTTTVLETPATLLPAATNALPNAPSEATAPLAATAPAAVTAPEKVNKSETFRKVSAELGDTSPTAIWNECKKRGLAWVTGDVPSGLINAALKGKARTEEMDLDTILARLELVRGFAKEAGGKEQLLSQISMVARLNEMAEQVGGLENLSKFAAKV